MQVNIVPAVLELGIRRTQAAIDRLSELRAGIHLDILDGSMFGSSKNLLPEDLGRLRLPRRTSAHLMVQRPGTWLRACLAVGLERVVVQLEADLTPALLRETRRYFRSVIAIAPGTSIEKLKTVAPYAEGFQVMTVKPGSQGRSFQGQQLELIRQLRRRYRRSLIAVDGAIGPDTAGSAVAAGANELIVGSALRSSRNPLKAFRELTRLARLN